MFKNPNYKSPVDLLSAAHGAALDAYFAGLADTVEAVTADDIRAAVAGLSGCTDGEVEALCTVRGFARA